jgi:hypothetical protein
MQKWNSNTYLSWDGTYTYEIYTHARNIALHCCGKDVWRYILRNVCATVPILRIQEWIKNKFYRKHASLSNIAG